MASVAGAAAEGLESGFNLGLRFDAQQQAQKQREFENTRQTAADQRAQDLADRQAKHDQWAMDRQTTADQQAALLGEQSELAKEAAAAAAEQQRTGQAPPAQYQQDFTQRQQANASALRAVRDKLVSPLVGQMKQEAQDTVSKLQTGQLDIRQMDPAHLVQTITATTDRPVADFMPTKDGQPSVVAQAVTDFKTGQSTGNEQMMLRGLNALFQPELAKGLGETAPNGGRIVAKRLVKIVPDQNDPTKIHPVLAIDTVDANGNPLPPYIAPVTQNRSAHPGDMVASLDMEDAVDRIHRLEAVSAMAANPGIGKALAAGQDDPSAQAYLNSLRHLGASPKVGATEEKENAIKRYMLDNGVDRDTAVAAMQKAGTLPTPKDTTTGPLGKKLADIKKSDLSEADKAQAARVAAGLIKVKPTGPAAAPGVNGDGTVAGTKFLSPAEIQEKRQRTVDFYATQSIAGDNGWQVGLARGKVGQALIAAVKDRIPEMAQELGLSPQDVGTNKAQYAAYTKTLADRQKYTTAVEQYNDTLLKQGELVKSLLAKGGATEGGPLFNKPINALKGALGDADYNNLRAALVGLAREHQRLLTGPMSNAQLTVSATHTGDQLANADLPSKTIVSLIDNVMAKEAANGKQAAREALQGVRDRMSQLGKPTAAPAAQQPQTATNPKTGERIKLVNGQWVPA
jgi:hypothetical protein